MWVLWVAVLVIAVVLAILGVNWANTQLGKEGLPYIALFSVLLLTFGSIATYHIVHDRRLEAEAEATKLQVDRQALLTEELALARGIDEMWAARQRAYEAWLRVSLHKNPSATGPAEPYRDEQESYTSRITTATKEIDDVRGAKATFRPATQPTAGACGSSCGSLCVFWALPGMAVGFFICCLIKWVRECCRNRPRSVCNSGPRTEPAIKATPPKPSADATLRTAGDIESPAHTAGIPAAAKSPKETP